MIIRSGSLQQAHSMPLSPARQNSAIDRRSTTGAHPFPRPSQDQLHRPSSAAGKPPLTPSHPKPPASGNAGRPPAYPTAAGICGSIEVSGEEEVVAGEEAAWRGDKCSNPSMSVYFSAVIIPSLPGSSHASGARWLIQWSWLFASVDLSANEGAELCLQLPTVGMRFDLSSSDR